MVYCRVLKSIEYLFLNEIYTLTLTLDKVLKTNEEET